MLETKSHTAHTKIHTHTHHTNYINCFFSKLQNICTVYRNREVLSGEVSHLKCAASGDRFVCIERGADVFAEKLADSLFDRWDSRGSSNNLHSVDVITAQLCHKTHTTDWVDSSFLQHSNTEPWSVLGLYWRVWSFKASFSTLTFEFKTTFKFLWQGFAVCWRTKLRDGQPWELRRSESIADHSSRRNVHKESHQILLWSRAVSQQQESPEFYFLNFRE